MGAVIEPTGTAGVFNPSWWELDPANYAIAGKSNTQLVIRFSLMANAVAPAASFSGGLTTITSVASANTAIGLNLGSVVASTATITTPAASSMTVVESAPFTFPTAGAYVATVNVSATIAATSACATTWQLFVTNS